MSIETRPANPEDASFLAWVMQEAARSHLEKGFWDLAFPGDDGPRLEILAAVAVTERVHYCHWSRFYVLEADGERAAALSAYENSRHGMPKLVRGMAEALSGLGWSPEQMLAVNERAAPFAATGYPNPDGLWIVEWVATRPEFRGRGLIQRLLREILDQGRDQGYTRTQIGYLLGNTPAKNAYEKAGFKWVEEHCHPVFEETFGTPGLARMQRDLVSDAG